MEVREHKDELVSRIRILLVASIALLVVIAGNFWFVQLVEGARYRGLAESNRLRQSPVEATRGVIHDRHGRTLAENVPTYNLRFARDRSRDPEATLAFVAEVLDRPLEELEQALERPGASSSLTPALLAENLGLAQVSRISAKALEYPELEVEVGQLRLYRHGAQTAHVLGYLGEVSEEELATSSDHLEAGDLVGKKGIERAWDRHLRGDDGERVVVVDSRGRLLEEFRREEARPGDPLTLTLDLDLQQAAAEAMAGKVGAVVALDPRTGEVRAMLSTPGYDPNRMSGRLSRSDWRAILEADHDPLQNRTVQNTYPPGSVFKIVVAAAGLTERMATTESRVYCPGWSTYYGRRFRCWNRGGHGWVDLEDALATSCDIYFYELGKNLGIERIARYARIFGLGVPTGLGLGGEKAGLVPDPAWKRRHRGEPWFPGDTISVSIGQGQLLTTPIQIATMTAGVANGGRTVRPHLVVGEPAPRGGLELPPGVLDPIRRALWQVVNGERGTARDSRLEGHHIAGKTSTVQVITQSTWTKSEDLPYELRDHAWFASFAPATDPELVVVVFVEHGGGGSRAAAPVAKTIYERYFGIAADGAAG